MFYEEGTHYYCTDNKPNYELAWRHFKEAYNIGDPNAENEFKEARFKLGQYHQYGYGGQPININLAISNYEKAAIDKHIESMNALGSMYFNEIKDYDQAAEWFR